MTRLPAGFVDVHAHVLDPTRPPVPGAAYAAFSASPQEYDAHLRRIGAEYGVLVTASVHGTDNEPLVRALEAGGRRWRGIAVVDPDVTDLELDRLGEYGVCGLRLQDLFPGGTALDAIDTLGPRLAARGWHLEIWTDLSRHLDWLPDALARCPVPVVLDHFGFLHSGRGTDDPALRAAVELARDGHVWITMSGAYRLAPDCGPDQASTVLRHRVRHLLDTVPERLLWGSDWPHVAPPNGSPSSADLIAEINLWLPGDDERHQVLTANPARCYGFD